MEVLEGKDLIKKRDYQQSRNRVGKRRAGGFVLRPAIERCIERDDPADSETNEG